MVNEPSVCELSRFDCISKIRSVPVYNEYAIREYARVTFLYISHKRKLFRGCLLMASNIVPYNQEVKTS